MTMHTLLIVQFYMSLVSHISAVIFAILYCYFVLPIKCNEDSLAFIHICQCAHSCMGCGSETSVEHPLPGAKVLCNFCS